MTTNNFVSLSAKAPDCLMSSVSLKRSRLAALSRKLGISGSPQEGPFTLPKRDSETACPSTGVSNTNPLIPCEATVKQTNTPLEADGPVKADSLSFNNIEKLKGVKEELHNHYGQTADDMSWDPDLDLNQDGRIDIRDKRLARDAQHDYKTLVRENYGKTASDTDWDANADLNDDGRIDIRDKRLVRDLLV